MALQVNITNIAQVTYPVDVYVCGDCPDTDCTLVDTINSVPATITIPGPYSGYSSFGVKIIDDANCEYCQTFQGTTTTSTTTINPLCVSCDIGFDLYDTNPISEISVGLITASCDPSITDYVIEWYGPGVGSTTVAFTSGYGSDYLGDYLYTHPLTGSSAVPVVSGVYTPIIQKIKINGTEYTDLNCFNSTTVDVDALTCDNGSPTDVPQYSHKLSFSAITNVTPQPVTTTFILDPLKPYFAFRFVGEEIYDTLKITFYGSNYQDPIVVEYVSLGDDLPQSDFRLITLPKLAKTVSYGINSNYSKVLNLSNFTVNNGDYLEVEVIPNPINNNTSWKFYCECLETFDCNVCYDTNINSPLKIIESSINITTNPCGLSNLTFNFSGCPDSDIYKYLFTAAAWNSIIWGLSYYTSTNFIANLLSPNPQTFCDSGGPSFPTQCSTPSSETITYSKTVPGSEGLITMTFTNYNDLEDYYNEWQLRYLQYSGNPIDCTDPDFYRWFQIQIPLASGSDNCGDTTGYQSYYIHPSAVVTTGGTGPYTMTITMPTISKCITFTPCETGCDSSEDIYVNFINNSSTATTNNISIVSNTGSKLDNFIIGVSDLTVFNQTLSATTYTISMSIPKYVNQTVPYSGNPLTLIPSLGAELCDFNTWTFVSAPNNLDYYLYYGAYIQLRYINPLDPQDFELWSPTFVNGTWAGYPALPTLNKIYDYIGGVATIYDSNYFV
jgi:hypothetical protein